jgi:uncharacterized protein
MNKRVNNWLNPKLEVKDTDKHGQGVFAQKNIVKNEILAIFGGHIMNREEKDKLPEDVRNLALGIDDDMFIGPISKEETDDAEWFNHSCEPNAGLWGQIMLVAMRDIKADEEITFDYCMSCSQKGQKRILFSCNCGATNCRKEITNHDWDIPALQQKYKGYFSFFVQRNINETTKNQ